MNTGKKNLLAKIAIEIWVSIRDTTILTIKLLYFMGFDSINIVEKLIIFIFCKSNYKLLLQT